MQTKRRSSRSAIDLEVRCGGDRALDIWECPSFRNRLNDPERKRLFRINRVGYSRHSIGECHLPVNDRCRCRRQSAARKKYQQDRRYRPYPMHRCFHDQISCRIKLQIHARATRAQPPGSEVWGSSLSLLPLHGPQMNSIAVDATYLRQSDTYIFLFLN